jgi:dTDP-4-dehydrorhamnose 3,5-epimerase
MNFHPTAVDGAYVVELETRPDERGFFARAFCVREFGALGLDAAVMQVNNALNHRMGTVRGLHYQAAPSPEAKFFRCISGANHHVVADMRPDSPTYLRHFGVDLSRDNRLGLYVPPFCAHGYQSLTDDSEALYLVSGFYHPDAERGIRYDDPVLGIRWPLPAVLVSAKDLSWPPLCAGSTKQPSSSS